MGVPLAGVDLLGPEGRTVSEFEMHDTPCDPHSGLVALDPPDTR
jgi:hypothetical protein